MLHISLIRILDQTRKRNMTDCLPGAKVEDNCCGCERPILEPLATRGGRTYEVGLKKVEGRFGGRCSYDIYFWN